MDYKQNKNVSFVDISSNSKKRKVNNPIDSYGKLVYKNLAKVIKFIAYALAILIVLAGIIGAFFIQMKLHGLTFLAVGLFFAAAVVAFIAFFIIYGIGHIIAQNEEILKRLNRGA